MFVFFVFFATDATRWLNPAAAAQRNSRGGSAAAVAAGYHQGGGAIPRSSDPARSYDCNQRVSITVFTPSTLNSGPPEASAAHRHKSDTRRKKKKKKRKPAKTSTTPVGRDAK